MTLRRVAATLLMFTISLVGCAPPAQPQSSVPPPQPSTFRRLVAAMKTVPPFLYQKLNPANVSGGPELCDFVGSGLTYMDDKSQLTPMLAEAVPTTDNGLWVVCPDGRMENCFVKCDASVPAAP